MAMNDPVTGGPLVDDLHHLVAVRDPLVHDALRVLANFDDSAVDGGYVHLKSGQARGRRHQRG